MQGTVSLSPVILGFVMGELLKGNLVKEKYEAGACYSFLLGGVAC